ncbi:hypothetical protein K1719_029933 [Acacia pycnantha]|nr:hypothetical protein K1719_029933 [Acacia pycnantha]
MRNRLWDRYQILDVLRNLKGTNRIHGIVLDLEKGDAKGQKIDEAISGKNLRCGSSLANVVSFFKQMHRKYFQRVERDIEAGVIHTKAFISMVNLMLLQINDLTLEAILRVCGIGKAASSHKEDSSTKFGAHGDSAFEERSTSFDLANASFVQSKSSYLCTIVE